METNESKTLEFSVAESSESVMKSRKATDGDRHFGHLDSARTVSTSSVTFKKSAAV